MWWDDNVRVFGVGLDVSVVERRSLWDGGVGGGWIVRSSVIWRGGCWK